MKRVLLAVGSASVAIEKAKCVNTLKGLVDSVAEVIRGHADEQ
jgi:hypothetical protein